MKYSEYEASEYDKDRMGENVPFWVREAIRIANLGKKRTTCVCRRAGRGNQIRRSGRYGGVIIENGPPSHRALLFGDMRTESVISRVDLTKNR